MKCTSKSLLAVLLLILISSAMSLATGTPKLISYQGKVTNSSGNPVADGLHDIWIFIYTSSSGASNVWSDNVSIQTENGLFSYILGSDPSSPLPDSIFTKYDSLFLGIIFEGEQIVPLTPLTSTPYAFRVNSIDGAKGGSIDGHLALVDTTIGSGATFAQLKEDNSGGGAGYLEIYRSSLTPGFVADGNFDGTEQPRTILMGDNRYVSMNMSYSGTESVMLPGSAIDAIEIKDEPGVGSYINQNGYYITTVGVNYLGSRAMFAPADGYVLVIASATVTVYHNPGTSDVFYFGISDNCTSLYQSSKVTLSVSSSNPVTTVVSPITVHGLFPIDSGTTTFCFMVEKLIGNCDVKNITITELFVPTAYTTVISPSATKSADDPQSEREAEEAFQDARIKAELDKMKLELEMIRQELKAEKQLDNNR